MTYLEQLSPWCIVRLLPNIQNQIVARFRRRSDAEAHLQVLRRLTLGDFQQINYSILWGGHLARPQSWAGKQDAHPTINTGIFFYLSVPRDEFYNRRLY